MPARAKPQKAESQRTKTPPPDSVQHPAGRRGRRTSLNNQVKSLDYEEGKKALSPHGDMDGKKSSDKTTTLDLSGLINASNIAWVLRNLANEPGEAGGMEFAIEAMGRLGSGVVNARLSGLASLQIKYHMNDHNFHVIEIDVDGALRAGLDLAGFASVGVEMGGGGDLMNRWYSSTEDAATWILEQLVNINDMAGGGLFNLELPEEAAPAPAYSVTEHEVDGGVFAQAGLGKNMVDGSYTLGHQAATYQDAEGHNIPSTVDKKTLAVGIQGKAGKVSFRGQYLSQWSNTVGSPIYYANGVFHDQKLTLSAGLAGLMKLGKQGTKGVAPDKIQDLVSNAFSAMENVAGPFKWANQLTSKLFNHVITEIDRSMHTSKGIKGEVAVKLTFDWNEYGEQGGDMSLMYLRTLVELERGSALQKKTLAGSFAAGMKSGKSEVVYEKIGTETISYVQRQFIYQTKERPWADFKEKNREQLSVLVENCATPGFLYHYPEVEAAFNNGEGGNYEAGMAALERVWTRDNRKVLEVGPDAAKVGNHVQEGTSIFTVMKATKEQEVASILEIFQKYENRPELLDFFVQQLPNYAVDIEALKQLAEQTGQLKQVNNYLIRAGTKDHNV